MLHFFLSLKLSLSAGQNISSKKWLCDVLLNGDSNILPMVFHSQCWVGHKLGEKKTIMQNNFTFHRAIIFFKCPTLRVSKINCFLDLKRNKRRQLLDNKSRKPLDTKISSWINDFVDTCLYNCGTHFQEN